MISVSEESAVDFESTARIATEAFGSKDVNFSAERMRWLYERGFGRGSIVVAAFDGEKKVGQIVMLRQSIYLDGQPVAAIQLIDLFILQAYRSATLVRRIYKEVERLCESNQIRVVLTLPNEISASLNARFLKLNPFLSLPPRAGISLWRPSRAGVNFSAALKTLPKNEAIARLSGFVTPAEENGPHWDAETLYQRISDPTCDYAVHATANLLLVSSTRKTRGIRHVLLCGFFARPQAAVGSGDVRDVIRAACHFWKHRVFVYAGLNKTLPYLPGFALPARLRAPILVQLRDSDSDGPRFDRFQLTDCDFV
jgi:Acetyltransferase (GNAT) domain